MAKKCTLSKTTLEEGHLGELLEGRLDLERQVMDMGSGKPLKVLEPGSDVCTLGL